MRCHNKYPYQVGQKRCPPPFPSLDLNQEEFKRIFFPLSPLPPPNAMQGSASTYSVRLCTYPVINESNQTTSDLFPVPTIGHDKGGGHYYSTELLQRGVANFNSSMTGRLEKQPPRSSIRSHLGLTYIRTRHSGRAPPAYCICACLLTSCHNSSNPNFYLSNFYILNRA
jgi:hypothetical protein